MKTLSKDELRIQCVQFLLRRIAAEQIAEYLSHKRTAGTFSPAVTEGQTVQRRSTGVAEVNSGPCGRIKIRRRKPQSCLLQNKHIVHKQLC